MSQPNNQMIQRNLRFLAILLAGLASIAIFRFTQISLFKTSNGQDLTAYHETGTKRSSITEARRGSIFDQQGNPIAMDTTSYSLFAVLRSDWGDTNLVKDPDVTAKALAKHLGLDRDKILAQLTQNNVYQVEFGNAGQHLSSETKKAIEAENLPGLVFVSETTRKYVNDVYASHLIGYATAAAKEEDQPLSAQVLDGKLGLEAAYNVSLSGQDSNQSSSRQLIGKDLHLTLDSRLQNKLEELMSQYQATYQPEALQAYLVEAKTGKLVAASQRPSFNLNTREGIEAEWKNLMVEEAYEPGSTIKILTMSVAYDRQLYKPGELYQSGSIQVYDQVVKDYNKVGWGQISFEEGLARSSNVAMVNLVNRMGDQEWVKKLGDFGFGKGTDFGLENETTGNFQFDNPVSRIMSGFGQGFSATPIQLLQAYSSIGNQGQMLKVQVVQGLDSAGEFQARVLGKPISKEAANHVLQLMVDTVEKPYGTAVSFRNPYVKVAAKTGTAQIADPNGSGYLTGANDYYHSVVTFFPADNPKYMLYMAMKRPQQDHGLLGSQILGKLFNDYIEYIMVKP
ncbi:peptidoglycan D,D-transpeptidase FtsI family protein [Abiotrophia defectiva]|uniref:Penicillin-binding protein, transpeptidase domain protein n=1 Tax=Abiotrophia defectiva ATCC 49176 TaxID=592010 RepID=W1Q5R0_ABIDE|nr:penicillin-binding protein 2 [Abiotrophia defectiva]ESK66598.1 penicillin-binding protein, transpeptidase domain protein [Abiotrophia defectiva ATCC 49176]QKH46301.1 penicillin-binding protein 2 [Abiotrophia defectiva]